MLYLLLELLAYGRFLLSFALTNTLLLLLLEEREGGGGEKRDHVMVIFV